MTTVQNDQYSPELISELVNNAARFVRALKRTVETPAGGRVLSVLAASGPMGVTELARIDGCSQPTMSASVATLVELGFVTKEPHPTDARGAVVSMTEAGHTELDGFRQRYAAWISERLAGSNFTEEQLAAAVAVLGDIVGESSDDCARSR